MATIQRVKFVQSLMLIHITIVKKYTIISIIIMGLLLVAMATIEVDSVQVPRSMVIGVVLLYSTAIS